MVHKIVDHENVSRLGFFYNNMVNYEKKDYLWERRARDRAKTTAIRAIDFLRFVLRFSLYSHAVFILHLEHVIYIYEKTKVLHASRLV